MPPRQKTDESRISDLKTRVEKLFPTIEMLGLTQEEWVKLEKEIVSHKIKKISSTNVLGLLSEITGKQYDFLETALRKTHEPRTTRNAAPSKPSSTLSFHNHRHKPYDTVSPLIMKKDPTKPPITTPKGVRSAELADVITPGHKPFPLQQTPEGTRYRKVASIQKRELFSKATPDKPKTAGQPLQASRFHYKRPESTKNTCRVTLEKIKERSGKKRRVSQRQLTGGTALEAFKMEGFSQAENAHGREFHWSHLIAHFLGGKHTAQNIVPTTARANYNTLNTIEFFISEKLSSTQNPIPYIDVEVTTRYGDDTSLVPAELIYKLTWKEKGEDQEDSYHIKPDSTTDYRQMFQAFAALRGKQVDADENNDELAPESPAPW